MFRCAYRTCFASITNFAAGALDSRRRTPPTSRSSRLSGLLPMACLWCETVKLWILTKCRSLWAPTPLWMLWPNTPFLSRTVIESPARFMPELMALSSVLPLTVISTRPNHESVELVRPKVAANTEISSSSRVVNEIIFTSPARAGKSSFVHWPPKWKIGSPVAMTRLSEQRPHVFGHASCTAATPSELYPHAVPMASVHGTPTHELQF